MHHSHATPPWSSVASLSGSVIKCAYNNSIWLALNALLFNNTACTNSTQLVYLSLSIFNAPTMHSAPYGTIIVLPAMYLVLCLVIIIPPHTPHWWPLLHQLVALMASYMVVVISPFGRRTDYGPRYISMYHHDRMIDNSPYSPLPPPPVIWRDNVIYGCTPWMTCQM